MDEADFVIVGAGSAGCVLAERLSREPGVRVLLLEAGGWDRDPWIRIPLGFGRMRQGRRHDWGDTGEPQPALGGRRIECRRGLGIGGSSSINAMIYARGHPADYARWAAGGLDDWGFAQVLPVFRQQECWAGGADEFRGGEGPLATRASRYDDPLLDALLDAGAAAGYPRTADYNGAQSHGMGRAQFTIRQGRRCSAADAFLRPALGRPNLAVRTGARALGVRLANGRAWAVDYRQDGEARVACAAREVVLAAGAVASPHLLMLSGIGEPAELAAHGIDVRVPLDGVGRNFQDHVVAPLVVRRRAPGPLHRRLRADRIAIDLARAWLTGRGFATDLPSPLAAFLQTDDALPAPDLQLMLHAGPATAHAHLAPFVRPYDDAFSLLVTLLHPASRGRVTLRSADPLAPPRIAQNLLATAADRGRLARGWRLAHAMLRQPALAPFDGGVVAPGGLEGHAPPSDDALDAHLRASVATVHHPAGTCRMGIEPHAGAVVDARLRVHGVDGLRVVDASVLPDLVGGNLNAPVMMIAGRAAEWMARGG